MTKDGRTKKRIASTPEEGETNRHLLQPADLARDIEELQEQVRQEHDRYLRTLADFTNYRRRTEREANRGAESGKREIILPLLDIVDDLERSLQWAGEESRPFADGVRLSYQKLLTLLKAHGVRPFESEGKTFTPELHDAVGVAKDAHARPGTILQEVRRGYLWNEELLRPAQVIVAEAAS